MSRYLLSIALIACFGGLFAVLSQTPQKPSVVTGDVVSVSDSKIVLRTKDGDLDALLSASTEFKKVPPDNPVLKAAVATELSDISEGDKLLITGVFGADKSILPARAVYLMSKSDIAQKQARETERWATRGISGRVASVDAVNNQVTIEVRGLMNSTSVVVSPKGDAIFKRYKQDSVKYSEARESSIIDIKPGDMFRAVGDRGSEGTTFAAEEIITGAFQTVAGTIKSVDTEKNEIVVEQAGTKKEVTVALTPSSAVKRFPEEIAQRMAGMAMGGAAGGPGGQGGSRPEGGFPGGQRGERRAPGGGLQGERPAGGQPGQGGQGRMMMASGGARAGIDDMFERFPKITINDLRVGDVIAVSSSKNATADHVNAIKLLAGVEPFLRAAELQAAAAAARGQRGGGQVGFSIPGLEGFDN